MDIDGYELIHQEGEISIYQNIRTQSLGKFFTKTITEQQYEEYQDSLNTRALLTDVLITGSADDSTLTDSAIKTYEKKQISGILTGDVQESYETVMSEEDRESAGSMQIELNLDSARRTEFPSAILEFTMTSDERNVLEIQINDGYSHEYVHNWDTPRKVHMELPQDAEKVTLTVKDPKGNIRIDSDSGIWTGDRTGIFRSGKDHSRCTKKGQLSDRSHQCFSGWLCHAGGSK